jgi:hypothetical protein
MNCTCKTPQTRTLNCFNKTCSHTQIVEISGAEKTSMCPVHRYGIAFCGYGSGNLYLCDDCKADGYAIAEGTGGGMFGPNYVLEKDGEQR